MSVFKGIAVVTLAFAVSACGFKPIYATPQGAEAAVNRQIEIRAIAASEAVLPLVTKELEHRIQLKDGTTPKYDLYVETRERAQRLAVQIDATVTRYNYRLTGTYTLIDLETGKRTKGRAEAVTSYNIVSSQYSTLFAERTAQEKAAKLLAEEIERDILLRLTDFNGYAEEPTPDELLLDEEIELLRDPTREGDVPDPFQPIEPPAAEIPTSEIPASESQ